MLSRDTLLLLAAGFCYFSSPMLVTPLITGFTGSLGGSAALMGVVGGLMNVVSLVCRPLLGGLVDRVSRYRLSLAGAADLFVVGRDLADFLRKEFCHSKFLDSFRCFKVE